jgi:hypothetical protein
MRRHAQDFIVNWGRSCWQEATTCRECDQPVHPLDDICPSCGAGHPGRVRMTVAVVISLTILMVLLAYACL